MSKFQKAIKAELRKHIPRAALPEINQRRQRRGLMPLLEGMTFREGVEQTRIELKFMAGEKI